jgi:tetratricopeptide (TPR) repeat protein
MDLFYKCHKGKWVDWATNCFNNRYSPLLPKENNYGELLLAVSKFTAEREPALFRLLTSDKYPSIIQAAAIDRYKVFALAGIIDRLPLLLKSDDPVKAVRMEVLTVFNICNAQLDAPARLGFDTVLKEYLLVQQSLSPRPEGFLNRGILLTRVGRQIEAEQVYLKGIKRFPKFISFYANLADHYRTIEKEMGSKKYIDPGPGIQHRNAELRYAIGLWHSRKKKVENGIKEIKKADQLNPSGHP